jgi:hypothetical protein
MAKWWRRNPEADPVVAKHFKKGELEKLCPLDFHFKEAANHFRDPGLRASVLIHVPFTHI